MNISPSIILPILLKPEIFHKKCQADLAAVSINGLTSEVWSYDTFENNFGTKHKLK